MRGSLHRACARLGIRAAGSEPHGGRVDILVRYCELPRAKSGQQRTAGPRRFDDLVASAEKLPGCALLTLS
jgi:hypothetical protein